MRLAFVEVHRNDVADDVVLACQILFGFPEWNRFLIVLDRRIEISECGIGVPSIVPNTCLSAQIIVFLKKVKSTIKRVKRLVISTRVGVIKSAVVENSGH